MRRASLFLTSMTAMVTLMAGCGSSPTVTVTAYPSLSGNWQMQTATAGSPTTTSPLAAQLFIGALTSSGSQVSGTLMFDDVVTPSPCVTLNTLLTATGTVTAAGAVSLSGALGGGTATLTFSAAAPIAAFTNGTVTISGGSCARPSTPFTFAFLPNVSGTYAGTAGFTFPPTNLGTTGVAQLQLVQSDTANARGQFPLTGVLTTVANNCTLSQDLTGVVNGIGFQLSLPAAGIGSSSLVLAGTADLAVPTIPLQFSAQASVTGCPNGYIQGSLTKQ